MQKNGRGLPLPSVVLGFATRPVAVHFTRTLLEPTRTFRPSKSLPGFASNSLRRRFGALVNGGHPCLSEGKSHCLFSTHSAPRPFGNSRQNKNAGQRKHPLTCDNIWPQGLDLNQRPPGYEDIPAPSPSIAIFANKRQTCAFVGDLRSGF